MRYLTACLALWAAMTLAACSSTNTRPSSAGGPNAASPPAAPAEQQTSIAHSSNNAPPISSAHNGAAAQSAPVSSEKPDVDTSELDEKIAKAESKAKAKNASESDRLAAAVAYVERANIYYNAGRPNLYKFALGDFRRALRYQPDNAEAREKLEMLVSIYQSMGRPIPNNGNEP